MHLRDRDRDRVVLREDGREFVRRHGHGRDGGGGRDVPPPDPYPFRG